MSNLNIENLSKIVQVGDADALMGQSSAASEMRAVREAKNHGLQGVEMPPMPGVTGGEGGSTFSDVLRKSVEKVNDMQVQANTAVNELVAGRSKNVHETLLTIERADDSLKLMMQVRNKILDAYREIMRMQV